MGSPDVFSVTYVKTYAGPCSRNVLAEMRLVQMTLAVMKGTRQERTAVIGFGLEMQAYVYAAINRRGK